MKTNFFENEFLFEKRDENSGYNLWCEKRWWLQYVHQVRLVYRWSMVMNRQLSYDKWRIRQLSK